MGVAPKLWLHSIDPSVSCALEAVFQRDPGAAPAATTGYSRTYAGDRTMIPTVDYIRILPELVLSIFGILVMLVDPVIPDTGLQEAAGLHRAGRRAGRAGRHCLPDAAITATPSSTWCAWMPSASSFILSFCWSRWSSILSSFDYLEVQQIKAGEYYGLILFATVGMMLMSSAIELVLIFIALEISSISTYILAGIPPSRCGECRVVAEVLPAGIVRDRVFPVRRGNGVRRDGNDQRLSHRSGICSPQHSVLVYLAVALMFVGLGLQGCVGAVPRVDARCLRRRARAGCGVDVHRHRKPLPSPCCCACCSPLELRDGSGWCGYRPCCR